MKRQQFIGKYCDLVDNHYETALRLSEIEVSGTADEDTGEKRAVLKEELEQIRSQLVGVRKELEVEDFDYMLRTLLK